MKGGGTTHLLRTLNVIALGVVWLTLFRRSGSFSPAYWAVIGVGAVAIVIAVLSIFSRNPLARLAGTPAVSRPGVRAFLAMAPWVLVLATTVVAGAWWTLQSWAVKLMATYATAAWSAVFLFTPRRHRDEAPDAAADGTATDRVVRRLLLAFAAVLGLLGIDGLAFGLTPVGVVFSATFVCIAASALATERFGRPSTRTHLAAASFGLLLGLVAVEAGIRVLRLGESVQEVENADYVRQFHHMTPPHSAFLNRPKSLDEFPPALIEINGLGIRGPEIPPGPVDLLLIGDSMVEARQLPWEATLGPKLTATLAARSAPARVVAHGMRGWAPLLYWNWYLKIGRSLHPRTVLVFFFWNDLWPSGDEAQIFRAVMGPDGRPAYFDVPVEPAWVWYKHVRSVRLVEEGLQRLSLTALRRSMSTITQQTSGLDRAGAEAAARRMAGEALLAPAEVDALLKEPLERLSPRLRQIAGTEFWPGMRPFNLWTDAQRQAAARTERTLQRFAEDVAADGGRLAVVYVPNAYQVGSSECSVARYLVGLDGDRVLPPDSGIQTWIRSVAERHGIEVIDPSDAMRAYHATGSSETPPLYLRADCHWSERGHQFMAEFLADWYLRSAGRRP